MNPYKRVHSPAEYDLLTTDQARKKYITEQFAEQMEAMSLNSGVGHHFGNDSPSPNCPNPSTPNNDPMSITPSLDNTLKDWARTNLVQTRVHGTMLPFEQRPGESKLRIPDFLLQPSSTSRKPAARDFVEYSPLAWRTATATEEAEINSTEPTSTDIDNNNNSYELYDESSVMEID